MYTLYYIIDVRIDPVGVVELIVHENLTVTCQAFDCKDSSGLSFFNNASGAPQDNGLCTTVLDSTETKTCNAIVDMSDNGTLLLCGAVRKSGNNYSDELMILVQGQLHVC